MLSKKAYMKFSIIKIIYWVLSHSCWEISCDNRIVTMKPIMDIVRTAFVIVFWIAAASSFCFLPSFSEVNLARAVGNASSVNKEKDEDRKPRIDRVPRSV